MKVVTTFHPPSSVVSSASCHLLADRAVRHLAVARLNKLEVYSAGEAGLKLESTGEIWGCISSVKVVPAQDNASADTLLVLTDHPDPRLLFYSLVKNEDESYSLVCARSISLAERGPRKSEYLQNLFVSPDGVAVVASVYAGKLKVLSLANDPPNVLDVPCLEYNLLSLAFVPSTNEDKYQLAMLFIDHQERIRLYTRELDPESGDLSSDTTGVLRDCMPQSLVLTEPVPQLIPVSADGDFPGGVLVVGGSMVSYYEAKKPKSSKKKGKKAEEPVKETKGKPRASVSWPWTEVASWCSLGPKRFLVGDLYGRLAMLSLDLLDAHGLLLVALGEVSPATTLSYVDNQVVFVGSHLGDSQVVRIRSDAYPQHLHPGPPILGLKHITPNDLLKAPSSTKGKGKAVETGDGKGSSKGKIVASPGSYIEVLSSWTNISPILDAVLADTDGSGLAQIFTASGGMSTGSIRVIRNGADFSELAQIEGAGNFTSIFPLRETVEASRDAFLLVTDGLMTQLLRVQPSGWERVDANTAGLLANSPTLAAGNMRAVLSEGKVKSYPDAPSVVQVTTDRIRLIDLDIYGTHTLLDEWIAPVEILHASVNESQVIVALAGGLLKMFVRSAESKLLPIRERQFPEEIAAVSFAPMRLGTAYSSNVIVAFWGSNSVEVFSLLTERTTFASHKPPVILSDLQALPRSVLLQPLATGPGTRDLDEASLLVGLADGTLVATSIKKSTLLDRRVFALGTAPVSLSRFSVQGHSAVFASGGRSAVLSWASGSLQNSPVLVRDVTAGTALSVDGWESCILLSTRNNLVVGQVNGVNRMQIRSIPFGTNNPVCIAHDPESHTFGVGCVRSDPVPLHDSVPTPSSHSEVISTFQVLDDTSFEALSVYSCQHHEQITSVTKFAYRSDTDSRTFFAAGSMFVNSVEHDQPTEGRVMLFDSDRARGADRLRPDAYAPVKGCVYALAECDGHLIASVNSAVVVFKYESGADNDGALQSVFVWNHDYLVTSLAVHGTRIFDGDAVHSVSALDLTRASGQAKLKTVARNYGPLWPAALGAWDKDTVIGSNADLNLFSFSLQNNGRQTLLERDGMFNVDDTINKFLPGALNADDGVRNSEISPCQLFFTASGRIGAILDMGTELSLHMSALQRNLGAVLSPTPSDDDAAEAHARWRAPAGRGGSMRSDADTGAFGFLDGDLLERFLELRPESELFEKVMKGSGPAEELQLSAEKMRGVLETMQGLH
ncbi:hypothetical protein PENSPDRAFT_609570 [Peniophora sp. CONT]|nr:hypothetical protein PENSPDRAFT_609570 [Peniophora sp. CONT]